MMRNAAPTNATPTNAAPTDEVAAERQLPAPPPGSLLRLTGIRREYGQPPHEVMALDNVDFHVGSGEMVAIMGPSGSGKSTLLTIAGGLEQPTSGSVWFADRQLDQLSAKDLATVRRTGIGFVFQGFNLLDGLTAVENVAAPLELDGVAAKAARDEAKHLLDSVGLGDRLAAFPDDLSGGERQRVAIARGLVGQRRLLLADEPTGALDSATGRSILQLLHDARGGGRAVVVVTHDPNVASWADRVVTLRDGRIESTFRPNSSASTTHDVGIVR